MSRTNHHRSQKSQHLGEDLWSRRIGGCLSYSAYNKKLTRRTERRRNKKIIENDLNE